MRLLVIKRGKFDIIEYDNVTSFECDGNTFTVYVGITGTEYYLSQYTFMFIF